MRRVTTTALFVLLLAAPVVLTGCRSFTELRMQPQVHKANAAFNSGNYALAAVLYESLSDRHPALPEREQLKFRQAVALYTLGSYHDSRNAFLAYLKTFPEGQLRGDVEIYLDKIEALLSPNNPDLQAAIDGAKKDLTALQQLRMQHPYNPAISTAIGNLYYEMGHYDEAMRYYFEALTIDAAYREKKLIQERMIIDEQGNPQPLTPEQLARIENEGQPLAVFATQQYLAREPSTYTNFQNRFFNVTGLVRNQGTHFIPMAVVEVRFYNALHQVMDVAVAPVGPMGPGEIRAFRAEADSYDNIYNITSYESIPRAEW